MGASRSEPGLRAERVGFDPHKLMLVMRSLPDAHCYRVGYSGGIDSTALLVALWQQREALPGTLCAVHVNHHINSASDSWQVHCQRVCETLHIQLDCKSVEVKSLKGLSLEAAAREQRYEAFRDTVHDQDLLLLAHHMDDQMETFLLQALRGSGPRGLAAMPVIAPFNGGYIARPLLGFTRAEIRTWADAENVSWLDDPSNVDIRFDRNYLRTRVIPDVMQRWPSAAATIARSAAHCSETLELLADLADLDLAASTEGRGLSVTSVRNLSPVRAKTCYVVGLPVARCPCPQATSLSRFSARCWQRVHHAIPVSHGRALRFGVTKAVCMPCSQCRRPPAGISSCPRNRQ